MPKRKINSIHRSIKQAELHLSQCDKTLAGLIDRFGPCRLYDSNALIHKPAFHALVWAIINQQLSVAAARSIECKLITLHRGDTFRQATIDRLNDDQLNACGLSRQKIRYLRTLCHAVHSRQLKLNQLEELDDKKVAEILISLPGIGPWTIDMFLMFALARLDVLPLGDLALRKAIISIYDIDINNNLIRFEQISQRWKPYRTVASWYLWCSID
jgi:DNA-3-methyladenine glycosylase II